jgi:hypothetical protein
MTSPSDAIGPPLFSEPDPIGAWKERYPGTTLDQLRELDDELFRNVLSWYASFTALAADAEDDDGE